VSLLDHPVIEDVVVPFDEETVLDFPCDEPQDEPVPRDTIRLDGLEHEV
jgi:hypothetical protein